MDLIQSPDQKIQVACRLEAGRPIYSIGYQGCPVVLESGLGFEPDFTSGFEILGTQTREQHGEWQQLYGERGTVPDHYRELEVRLRHRSGLLVNVTFRAYNEGAAFRYVFPANQEKQDFVFTGECTEFRFPENTFGYEEHGTEGEYLRVRTSEIEPWCERPLTLEYAAGFYAVLSEAANQYYPRMLLSPLLGVPGALVSALGGTSSNLTTEEFAQRHDPTAKLSAGDSTPWRVIVIGDRPGDLLERNYLILNLNDPCAFEDTAWIRPGKAMRDVTLTTVNSKAIIDFAEKAGLQYVSLDWKWYGSEDPELGDATTVRAPDLDVPEIVRYGRSKGVGLWVYVERRQLKKQRDILFPLYQKWGIVGVKIGFIDVGAQVETEWTTETIKKARKHHLMLNIHDGYRSTGLSRTWPNLVTVEGIRGNEHMPTAEHNCTLPFTRYIDGVGDYTVCYYSDRIKTTHAHQLAMAVVSYSPAQWLFWYDKPADYQEEPEIEFFQKVPTVWDETRVLDGRIGEYACIARRRGEEWFVGVINNSQPRTLRIPLSFLLGNRKYIAHLYSDNPSVLTRTKVSVEERPVTAESGIEATLCATGGQAIWIAPAS